MPLDFTARAQQVARIFQHAGDNLAFGSVNFQASISPYQPESSEADFSLGDHDTVLVRVARSVFGTSLPVKGNNFTDAAGNSYRIRSVRPSPPSHPTIEFICGSVLVPISP